VIYTREIAQIAKILHPILSVGFSVMFSKLKTIVTVTVIFIGIYDQDVIGNYTIIFNNTIFFFAEMIPKV